MVCRRAYHGKTGKGGYGAVDISGLCFPDDQFIRNYTRLVPDIKDLVAYGIGVSEVQEDIPLVENSGELRP